MKKQNKKQTRRKFLGTTGATIATAIAGCSTDDNTTTQNTPQEDQTQNGTEQDDQTEQEEEEETINRPDNYRIDFQPQKNEELRQIMDNPEPLNDNHPVFNYNTEREKDEHGLDLQALHAYNQNNWDQLARHDVGAQELKEALENENAFEKAKNDPTGSAYPNADGWGESGEWERETFVQAETGEEALAWLHPLVWNIDSYLSNEGEIGTNAPISTRDYMYAANIQKGINDYNENLKAHAWSFKVDGGSHGNGLIHIENESTGETELRIMESTPGYHTFPGPTSQTHPLVENSTFFLEESEARDRGRDPYQIFHPLRFHTDRFREKWMEGFDHLKKQTAIMFSNIGGDSSTRENASINNVATTNNFLEEVTEDLRHYNQRNIDFNSIVDAANIYFDHRLKDGNYIIGGTYQEPKVFEVESQDIIEKVWDDPNGEYNNFEEAYDRLE